MRFCAGLISNTAAVVLLAGCLFGQDSVSSPAPSTPPASAVALNSIDLKADASGVVPAAQIRELLQRAEEKDLENDKRQRDYTYVERVELFKSYDDDVEQTYRDYKKFRTDTKITVVGG